MGQLIGFFIRIITFPGLILDYYINKKTANFLSIFILKDDFSKVLSGEALEIDTTSKYYKLWLFSFLPLLIQTLIALIVCYFAAWAISISDVTVKGKIFFLIFSY